MSVKRYGPRSKQKESKLNVFPRDKGEKRLSSQRSRPFKIPKYKFIEKGPPWKNDEKPKYIRK